MYVYVCVCVCVCCVNSDAYVYVDERTCGDTAPHQLQCGYRRHTPHASRCRYASETFEAKAQKEALKPGQTNPKRKVVIYSTCRKLRPGTLIDRALSSRVTERLPSVARVASRAISRTWSAGKRPSCRSLSKPGHVSHFDKVIL